MTVTARKSIAIIGTSTRTPRIGPTVAALVKSFLEQPAADANIDLVYVDLAKFNLPVYNEAVIPGMVNPAQPDGPQFAFEHSKAWSAEVRRHDGYVLVIPEYNYGLSGGTKNAIDYLHHEWKGKPAAIVSYGIKGGSLASEQAKHVLEIMGLKVAETRPQLAYAGGNGPDLFAGMLKGELGEESRKAWEEKREEIVKAFDEVRKVLDEEIEKT